MSQAKILVDTNSYLRLAKTIRPLLFVPFGNARVMPTLELLKIMLDCGHTNMKTIEGLCDYWRYIADLPANFNSDYKRLFGKQ